MSGTVVVINGASSSGKSSILLALQEASPQPYMDMGVDRFISMLPARYLRRPLWDDVLGVATEPGAAGRALFSGMHQAIAAMARLGNNVVADHVLVTPSWVQECAVLFADLPAYLIGVRCPLDLLEQRERQRKNRTLGQARLQFDLVRQYCRYDLELDTSRLSPQECAHRILARLETPPSAFLSLNSQ